MKARKGEQEGGRDDACGPNPCCGPASGEPRHAWRQNMVWLLRTPDSGRILS